ncbi:heavy metal-binding protein HIP-like [Ruditapes philippinarum]|uniref:heavy metal-binding protein HIP-like n=1 Tax=Ruditapes philippinarum TaxID=129788 RepID=UPI00295B0CF8|nr:heavy metal-binding protein HIP-like [Ruditapes philippinarum]
MHQVLILICLAVSGMATAESETESAILKRLEATERLVQSLFDEVESLKVQDQIHKEQIVGLKKQLHWQRQRNSYLGKLNRLRTGKLKTGQVEDTVPVSNKNPDHVETKHDAQVNRIRRAENEIHVAFFAKMDKHLVHAGIHQNIVFDTVVTNVGNGYHSHVGTFIAPVSGTYVFSATLVSFYHVNAHAEFVKNGQVLTTMFVNGAEAGYDTTSQTIVLQLQKGDDVVVQNKDADKSFYGTGQGTFSGFLLFEDFSSPSIVGK